MISGSGSSSKTSPKYNNVREQQYVQPTRVQQVLLLGLAAFLVTMFSLEVMILNFHVLKLVLYKLKKHYPLNSKLYMKLDGPGPIDNRPSTE